MTLAKNITGQRFGFLIAVRPTEKRRGRKIIWECFCDCGGLAFVTATDLIAGHTKSCGCWNRKRTSETMKGRLPPSYKGGRTITNGRVYILNRDHPNAHASGYIMEHRLVMEKILGRYLTCEEVVHHIDNNPSNNSPDNLMLFSNKAAHRRHHARLIADLAALAAGDDPPGL